LKDTGEPAVVDSLITVTEDCRLGSMFRMNGAYQAAKRREGSVSDPDGRCWSMVG
jgi:hypothetical protein